MARKNYRLYQELVPMHAPSLMLFAVIREVIYTPLCDMQMRFFMRCRATRASSLLGPMEIALTFALARVSE